MKRFSLLIMAFLTLSFTLAPHGHEKRPLPLTIKVIKPGTEHKPLPKSPVMAPEVYLDSDILYFDEALEGCTVQLAEEDETIVFTEFIEENQTSLTFPATLTGTFELQILTAQYIFYCEIEL